MSLAATLLFAGTLALAAEPVVEPPRWVEAPAFAWPDAADPGLGPSRVVLELLVDERGGIETIRVVEGPEPLVNAVRAALLGHRFHPATEDGVPVAVVVPLVVELVPPPVAAPPALPPAPVDAGIVGSYRLGLGEVSRQTMSAEELRTTPGTLGDPLRAVSNLPGTLRTPLDMGWLLVRGGDPHHTAVYVDGVRVPLVHHLGGFTSVIHPAYVERLEFLPGGGPVRYGRALAGTVDLVTRADLPEAEARLGANLVFAGAFASAPLGAPASRYTRGPVATASASVRRSYLDAVAAPFLPEAAAGALPRFWDWQARVDLDGRTSFFAFGYVDDIDIPGDDGVTYNVEVATQRLHARAESNVGGRDVVVTPAASWQASRLLREGDDGGRVVEIFALDTRVESPDPGDGNLGYTVGLDAQASVAQLLVLGFRRDVPIFTPDAYGELRLGRARGTHALLGVRVDSLFAAEQPARLGLSPRFSARRPLSSRSAVEAEVGVYHQPPPVEILVGFPEGASHELDEAVGAGVGGRTGAGPFDLSLDLWGRSYDRISGDEVDGSTDLLHGLAYGADLGLQLRWRRLAARARYSYARSLRREDPGDPWWPSAYDQPHTVGLVSSYDLGRDWTLAGRFRYATGFWVGIDGVTAVDLLSLTDEELHPSSGRVDDYHAVDLKLSKRFRLRRWTLDAYIDVQNLYNRRVPEPVITGSSAVFVDFMGYGLPLLPIFGVEGQWGG